MCSRTKNEYDYMNPAPENNPYASPTSNIGQSPLKPGRGGLILTFGIIGIVFCVFFGIAAWVMGKKDVAEMDAGRMDPADRGLTQAGYIIGMVSCILGIIGIVVVIVMIVAGVGMGAMSGSY
jgi:hypothetical protein